MHQKECIKKRKVSKATKKYYKYSIKEQANNRSKELIMQMHNGNKIYPSNLIINKELYSVHRQESAKCNKNTTYVHIFNQFNVQNNVKCKTYGQLIILCKKKYGQIL